MLKYIEEAGKFVEITGFRKIGIKDSEEFVEAARAELPQSDRVQFFDAKLVATWQHLFFAVLNALLAFKNELNISKSLAIESILYASAQRQIRKAIDFLGVKRSSSDIAVVIIGESAESVDELLSIVSNHLGKEPDSEVLEITNKKAEAIRKAFRITRTELDTVMEKTGKSALVDLVIERMALLSTQL